MSLHTDYRPGTLEDFIGNEDIKDSIKSVTDRENPPASFILTGKSGTGKTTLGRIIAKRLGCNEVDYIEIDGGKDTGVDATREVLKTLLYAPLAGKKKVILYDEAQKLSSATQSSLLKSLENPPKHVHFILCTTNPEALKITLKRRCHHYEISGLMDDELNSLMKSILKKEKVKKYSQKVLDRITELSEGSAGIALKLLDQVKDQKNPKKAINLLQTLGVTETQIIDICKVLLGNNQPYKIRSANIRKILKAFKLDPESARRSILGYLNAVWLNSGRSDIPYMMDCFSNNFYDSGKAGLSVSCAKAIEDE